MKNKTHIKNKPSVDAKPKRSIWILVLIVGIFSIGIFLWQKKRDQPTPSTSTTSSVVSPIAKSVTDPLLGRWVRTDSDGGYTIEITRATADGKLDASYFNPSLVKVGRAEWLQKDGNVVIIVELRDTNYPGSTYTLKFLPTEDRLVGNYFQAVEGSNYDVAFTRVR
jgi:hypothetical protein